MSDRRYAVIAGGGSGGHVVPALGVARALVAAGIRPEEVQLVASFRGPDKMILGDSGFPALFLPGRGIRRSLSLSALRANAGAVIGLLRAAGVTVHQLGRWRPKVVVSVGGYASFPAVIGAIVRRIPLVLVNIDAIPGAVHRLFGRFAVASCVGFEGTNLPHPTVVGAPVGEALIDVDRSPASRDQAKAQLGFDPSRLLVCVTGGSLGARSINTATCGLLNRVEDGGLAIYHVSGERDAQVVDAAYLEAGLATSIARTVAFERDMATFYTAADLVVCRSGAMTVAELAVTGVASVLVPLPGAPGDHQTKNAEALATKGAAVVISDDALDADTLFAVVTALADDRAKLEAMDRAAASLGHRDAAKRAAEIVMANAR